MNDRPYDAEAKLARCFAERDKQKRRIAELELEVVGLRSVIENVASTCEAISGTADHTREFLLSRIKQPVGVASYTEHATVEDALEHITPKRK